MTSTTYESPLGPLTLLGSSAGLAHVRFPARVRGLPEADCHTAALTEAVAQLEQYFSGQRQCFELELEGTTFQKRVWRALQGLPYGQTTTYGELADELAVQRSGNVSGARKVAWRSEPRPPRSSCPATA
jgi:methylated-DNA-[protein]-cysteine S-methyltransferase